MSFKFNNISISGFKSINELKELELKNINILIGTNGAGKSNFISAFKLISKISKKELQDYVFQNGSNPDDYLFLGRKNTKKFNIKISANANSYQVELGASANNELYIISEKANFNGTYGNFVNTTTTNSLESNIDKNHEPIVEYTKRILSSFKVYHFHDTSVNSPIKTPCASNDNLAFKEDGHNIAPFLKMLRESNKQDYDRAYNQIVEVIQIALPFFDNFYFRDEDNIYLEWFQKGNSETPLKGKLLSDGSLRFICLCVSLLQPLALMPNIIIIDEPELGLHPSAIYLLSELIKRVSSRIQIIISTQSTELIDYFEPKDIITTSRKNNESIIKRLDNGSLKIWLKEYTLGQIWSNNILDDSK